MLNARRVDNKFYISGGWQDIERDTEWLKTENIRAVLDVQYTPYDSPGVPAYIKDHLKDEDIEYENIPMADGENHDASAVFGIGQIILATWDQSFTNKKDRILIKCGAGTSRSVSQYLNYICFRDGISFHDAYWKLRKAEDKWATAYADDNYWPGMPSIEFVSFLKKKYPMTGSAFGEIIN